MLFGGGLETVAYDRKVDQNGLEGTLYGDRPFVRTERTQIEPPAGLAYLAAENNLFSATVGDGPQQGWEDDGWLPIWNEKWVHDKQRQQLYEWNTLGENSNVQIAFRNNMGVVFNNKGWAYVLPTAKDRGPAHHKINKSMF